MHIQRTSNPLLAHLHSGREKKQKLDELASDQFQYSRPKMVGLWAAAGGAAGLAGLGVSKIWDLAHLPTNFGPAGMLIGGSVGAAATYFALGEEVPMPKRLAVSLAAGAGSALAWNHFGLAGLKEGLGMAIGGTIGAYVGAKSVPEGQDSLLNTMAGATFGFGLMHVAGIVGATGGGLGVAGASMFPILGGAAGDIIAKGNRRAMARQL
jgi:hypothetical protein